MFLWLMKKYKEKNSIKVIINFIIFSLMCPFVLKSEMESYYTPTIPAPTLISPPKDSIGVNTHPSFSWNFSSMDTNTVYTLQVSPYEDFSSIPNHITTKFTSFGPIFELDVVKCNPNTINYWRVRASLNGEVSEWSEIWRFTTNSNRPPILGYIGDTIAHVGDTLSIIITGSDPDGDILYFVKDTTLGVLQGDCFTFVPNPEDEGNDIYILFQAVDSKGSVDGEVVGIQIFGPLAEIPVLLIPNNGSTDLPVDDTLKWKTSNLAKTYHLQLSTDTGFTNPIVDKSDLTDTTYAVNGLTNNTKYYWRVNAKNEEDYNSKWSSVWNFTTNSTSILPSNFKLLTFLHNIYSNIITYALPEQCFVSIKYYDIRGRVVSSYVNKLQKPGYYTVCMPQHSLSQGIYIQKFKAGEFVKNNKFTIIR